MTDILEALKPTELELAALFIEEICLDDAALNRQSAERENDPVIIRELELDAQHSERLAITVAQIEPHLLAEFAQAKAALGDDQVSELKVHVFCDTAVEFCRRVIRHAEEFKQSGLDFDSYLKQRSGDLLTDRERLLVEGAFLGSCASLPDVAVPQWDAGAARRHYYLLSRYFTDLAKARAKEAANG